MNGAKNKTFSFLFCCVTISPFLFLFRRISAPSVLLPGESRVLRRRIGTDIWQFDKVDLVS